MKKKIMRWIVPLIIIASVAFSPVSCIALLFIDTSSQVAACQSGTVLVQPATGFKLNAIPGYHDTEQVKNTATIIGIGFSRRSTDADIAFALAVAMQESAIRNLRYGHLDSLGLFQQRPSQGWGTPEQILDPIYSTNKFYTTLEKVENRDTLSPLELAKKTQNPDINSYVSGNFVKKVELAKQMVATLPQDRSAFVVVQADAPGVDCSQFNTAKSDVEIAVQAALSQQGKPYQWGSGQSDASFDCSDLMQFAYQAAGVTIPRVASEQYNHGTIVPRPGSGSPAQWKEVLRRGDLIYWAPPILVRPTAISHVAMYLGDGMMIDAGQRLGIVSVRPVFWSAGTLVFYGASRPITTEQKSTGSAAADQQHSGWRWPLDRVVVTSPFGGRKSILGSGSFHNGVDFAGNTGTPVKAVQSGKVRTAFQVGTYGNFVEIVHDGGIVTGYAHLSVISVVVDQRVSAGEVIGFIGSTGRSTGPHLHFNVRDGGQFVEPLQFMRQFGLVPHG